jgi:flagellar hook-associated protein 2
LRSLQASLLSNVTYSISGNSGLVNLASLGVDLNNDGTLTVNQTATDTHPSLSNVLAANPGAVQSFFQNVSSTGFANNFNTRLKALTDTFTGVISLDTAGNTAQQTALATQITNLQTRISAQQKQLTLLYDQVNATLEGYPSLFQEITAEIAALNPTSSTGVSAPAPSNTTPATGSPVG